MAYISKIKLPNNDTYDINASIVNSHTVESDVPSDAVFTDTKVKQTDCATDDANYRIILSGSADNTERTQGVKKTAHFFCNPNDNSPIITGNKNARVVLQNATADEGNLAEARIEIGNNKTIASSNGGGCFGALRIYDQSQYKTDIYHGSRLSANRSLYLPDKNGTIACTSDITDENVAKDALPTNIEGPFILLGTDSSTGHVYYDRNRHFTYHCGEETMRIMSTAGSIRLGNTVPDETNYKTASQNYGSLDYTSLYLTRGAHINTNPSGNQAIVIAASTENNYRVKLAVNGSETNARWAFCPTADGYLRLGDSGNRWKTIFAENGTINTSDRKLKKDIQSLDESVRDFILRLNPVSYKMKNGESGRTHYGLIAQDVEKTMAERGMTSMDFAGFCKDQKTIPCPTEEDDTASKIVEGEYVYGLRYEEFIAPMIKTIQMQQQEIDTLKSELAEIKAKLK